MRLHDVPVLVVAVSASAALAVSSAQALPAAPGAAAPFAANADTPRVRVSGHLLRTGVEKRGDTPWFAVRIDDQFLPVQGDALEALSPGSDVTLDVVVPQPVADAAAADRTVTIPSFGGRTTRHDLDPGDLKSASDATPASASSAIGQATQAAPFAPTADPLVVDQVVSQRPTAAAYTPATRAITYVEVTPRGFTREAVTSTAARAQVAFTDSYWSDNSSATLRMGAPTMKAHQNSSYACGSNPFPMWNEVATRAGWSYAANASLVMKLPAAAMDACGYGLGTIGVDANDAGMLHVSDIAWPVLAHELGHNLSMGHADFLACTARSDAPLPTDGWWPADCGEYEYGDGLDVMGPSGPTGAPMLSSPQAILVGTLPRSATTTVGAGTTSVTLAPLAGRTGIRAARVTNAITGITYYVEYRTAAGRDADNTYGQATGVRVLRYNPEAGSTVLLDPTPSGSRDDNAVLTTGRSLKSYDGRITVTTTSTSSNRAVVQISNDTSLRSFTTVSAPTITGTKGVGRTLTSSTGSWSPTPSSYAYRWRRNGASISGATARTYTPTTSDAGRYLTVTVTARRTGYTSKSSTSRRVGIPIHATTRPYLRGTARSGRPMTVYVGAWTPRPTSYAYQWYRNGSRISGATAKTYTLTSSDRGRKIQAKVTARRSGYSTGSTYTYSTTAAP